MVVSIIRPRLEETFEMVRDRLEDAGLSRAAGTRVVLTGGACQLPGCARIGGAASSASQVRSAGRAALRGLPDAGIGPAFATAAGLLAWAAGEGRALAGHRPGDAGGRAACSAAIVNFLRERV